MVENMMMSGVRGGGRSGGGGGGSGDGVYTELENVRRSETSAKRALIASEQRNGNLKMIRLRL